MSNTDTTVCRIQRARTHYSSCARPNYTHTHTRKQEASWSCRHVSWADASSREKTTQRQENAGEWCVTFLALEHLARHAKNDNSTKIRTHPLSVSLPVVILAV